MEFVFSGRFAMKRFVLSLAAVAVLCLGVTGVASADHRGGSITNPYNCAPRYQTP